MASLKPEELDSQIKSGKLSRVFVFDGPEIWLKERASERIIDKYIDKQARDLNLDRFDAADVKAHTILDVAQSMPFLSEARVVIVQNTQDFKTADTKLLAESVSNLPASTFLIFFYEGKAPLRNELIAQISSHGAVITYWTPFSNQLPRWVTTETKARGKIMDFEGARALADSCADLQEISGEIDKLILYTGNSKTITYQDVLAFGLPDGSADYSALEEAIWGRNLAEALNQGQLMSEMGTRAEAIFPVYERTFRKLILARYYLDVKKWTAEDVYKTIGIRGKIRQELLNKGLRSYQRDEINSSLDHITKANMDLKTGLLASEEVISLLNLNLLSKKELILGRKGS